MTHFMMIQIFVIVAAVIILVSPCWQDWKKGTALEQEACHRQKAA